MGRIELNYINCDWYQSIAYSKSITVMRKLHCVKIGIGLHSANIYASVEYVQIGLQIHQYSVVSS